jgi:response regulator NasT
MPTRVVIAEDEWLTATALRAELERQGYDVIGMARSGTEAVSLCAEQAPEVVMMDVQMPGMDGLEATRTLMGRRPTCVVVVTGEVRLEEAAAQAGAMCSVMKPLLGEQIPEVMATARERFQQFLVLRDGDTDLAAVMARWQVVRKAALALAEAEGISEQAAFRKLRQRAATLGVTLGAAAEGVTAQKAAA